MAITDKYVFFSGYQKFIHELEREANYIDLSYKGIALADCLLMPFYLSLLHEKKEYNNDSFNLFNSIIYRYQLAADSIQNKIFRVFGKTLNDIYITKYKNPSIFFPFDPAHLDYHLPLYRQLKQQKASFLIITTNKIVYQILTKSGYTPYFVNIHENEELKSFREKMNNFFSGLSSLFRKNHTHQIEKTKENLDTYLNFLISFLDEMERLIALSNPSSIIVGNDLTFQGRALTLLAKKKGINTICLMHGIITGEPLHACHIVDQFFVYGEKSKNELIRIGNSPQNLIITGTPFLDNLIKQSGIVHQLIRKHAHVDKDQKYILFAHSGPGHCTSIAHFDMIIKALIHASIELVKYRFIVKLHPKDKLLNYHELLTKFPEHHLTIVDHGNPDYPLSFLDWLQGCNLMITGTSAAAQEAMLLDIPVITMDFNKEYAHVDFIEEGATIHVTNPMELSSTINNILIKPELFQINRNNANKYLEQSFYKLDGNATRRCLDIILRYNKCVELQA